MWLSLPVGCTKEVKDLFKKQTMLLPYRILKGNAFGTQEVETDWLNVDDLSDLA
jgi:hypothetical protein